MITRRYNEPIQQDVSTRYASDLNDQEFVLIAPHVAQKEGSGKKRTVDIREVLNAIFYRTRTGCQWRMLPSDKGLVSRLNGMITNNKFCLTRLSTLHLSWSRRPVRLRRPTS